MIPISRKQLLHILVFAFLAAGAGKYALRPMYVTIADSLHSVYFHFQGARNGLLDELMQENKEFKRQSDHMSTTDPQLSASMFYDFLRTSFARHAIEAARFDGSGNDKLKVTCTADFHRIASCINEIENGPYICSLEELHLLSKSLQNSHLQVQLSFVLHRSEDGLEKR